MGAQVRVSLVTCYFHSFGAFFHFRGMIDDPGKDFFVEDNEVIERSALPLEYSDDYWERRYTIKPDQIPAFLHSHADKILRTGKYLNVIQQCHGDAKSKYQTKPEQNAVMDTSIVSISDGKTQ